MHEYERPRKQIRKDATAAKRRGSSVSRGLRSGTLKGKPKAADERVGRAKPGLGVARRSAADAERPVGGRRDLSLPMARGDMSDRSEGRSLRLSLRVEGDQISVVNAIEVDAPARELQQVRGTSFLEVRVGDQVLALEPLVDPGIAIGIPDASDKEEFRGHREIQQPSYEVAVRVPLEALESPARRDAGGPSRSACTTPPRTSSSIRSGQTRSATRAAGSRVSRQPVSSVWTRFARFRGRRTGRLRPENRAHAGPARCPTLVPLISKDQRIHAYARHARDVEVIW